MILSKTSSEHFLTAIALAKPGAGGDGAAGGHRPGDSARHCGRVYVPERQGGVEYYRARFPDCCSRHTSQEDIPIKSFATAVAVWTENWTLALCVNILCFDIPRLHFFVPQQPDVFSSS